MHGTQGRAADLPNSPHFKSRAERNYARLLTFSGVRWQYEPKTFTFARVQGGSNRRYKPDFFLPDEPVETYHEIKPFLDQSSQIKLNYMRRYFPNVRIILIDKAFFAAAERQGLCRLVPHWECPTHFPARCQTKGAPDA